MLLLLALVGELRAEFYYKTTAGENVLYFRSSSDYLINSQSIKSIPISGIENRLESYLGYDGYKCFKANDKPTFTLNDLKLCGAINSFTRDGKFAPIIEIDPCPILTRTASDLREAPVREFSFTGWVDELDLWTDDLEERDHPCDWENQGFVKIVKALDDYDGQESNECWSSEKISKLNIKEFNGPDGYWHYQVKKSFHPDPNEISKSYEELLDEGKYNEVILKSESEERLGNDRLKERFCLLKKYVDNLPNRELENVIRKAMGASYVGSHGGGYSCLHSPAAPGEIDPNDLNEVLMKNNRNGCFVELIEQMSAYRSNNGRRNRSSGKCYKGSPYNAIYGRLLDNEAMEQIGQVPFQGYSANSLELARKEYKKKLDRFEEVRDILFDSKQAQKFLACKFIREGLGVNDSYKKVQDVNLSHVKDDKEKYLKRLHNQYGCNNHVRNYSDNKKEYSSLLKELKEAREKYLGESKRHYDLLTGPGKKFGHIDDPNIAKLLLKEYGEVEKLYGGIPGEMAAALNERMNDADDSSVITNYPNLLKMEEEISIEIERKGQDGLKRLNTFLEDSYSKLTQSNEAKDIGHALSLKGAWKKIEAEFRRFRERAKKEFERFKKKYRKKLDSVLKFTAPTLWLTTSPDAQDDIDSAITYTFCPKEKKGKGWCLEVGVQCDKPAGSAKAECGLTDKYGTPSIVKPEEQDKIGQEQLDWLRKTQQQDLLSKISLNYSDGIKNLIPDPIDRKNIFDLLAKHEKALMDATAGGTKFPEDELVKAALIQNIKEHEKALKYLKAGAKGSYNSLKGYIDSLIEIAEQPEQVASLIKLAMNDPIGLFEKVETSVLNNWYDYVNGDGETKSEMIGYMATEVGMLYVPGGVALKLGKDGMKLLKPLLKAAKAEATIKAAAEKAIYLGKLSKEEAASFINDIKYITNNQHGAAGFDGIDDLVKSAGKPSKPVPNMKEFFSNSFGSEIKKNSSKTSFMVQGQSIYKVNEKIKGMKHLRTGDYYYLDGLHKNHLEVCNTEGYVIKVLNLDGTLNLEKTARALKKGAKVKVN